MYTSMSANECMHTHLWLEVYLLVLLPCGPLSERGEVPERQTTREVDDSQQGAIRTKTHAENTVLDHKYTHINMSLSKDNASSFCPKQKE